MRLILHGPTSVGDLPQAESDVAPYSQVKAVKTKNMSSTDEKRSEAGKKGGEAPHSERGLQAADEETRERVASAGGSAPHDERGLQAADETTRERVAKAGGEARAQDPESLSEAGRRGGEKVKEEYGPEHFKEIGKKGGEARSEER